MYSELIYQMALSQIPKIGPVLAKNLLSYCGSPAAVFREKTHVLKKVPGIGLIIAREVAAFRDFERLQDEVEFIDKHNIKTQFFTDQEYPYRLKANVDAPLMLFIRGNNSFESSRMIGVVGTRLANHYGTDLTQQLIKDLSPHGCTIVSGLAYGIDYEAHRAALKNEMPTIGILAHGLDRIYPFVHRNIAMKMIENKGSLVTEYLSKTIPDRENFPKRNRIVAGLVDALIVVQSPKKGGSLITANLAFQYDREVMAFPGRVGESVSEGCHLLIKSNKAHLIESAADVIELMGYDDDPGKKDGQIKLLLDLSDLELKVVNQLKLHGTLGVDSLAVLTQMNMGKLSQILLQLEIADLVRTLPGKCYELK